MTMAIAQAMAQPGAMLGNALRGVRSISTLKCSIVRKQSFNGVNKSAQCVFYFDRELGKCAYIYASPYEYTFVASDSVVCGVNRKTKQGYSVKATADASQYKTLLGSIDLWRPLLQFARMDTLIVSLKASINDFLFFERPLDEGKEMIKVDRGRNAVVGVELFDKKGNVRCQTTFDFDTTAGKKAVFPRRIAVRQNLAGIITTDTLLVSKIEINRKLKESAFAVPEFKLPGIQLSE